VLDTGIVQLQDGLTDTVHLFFLWPAVQGSVRLDMLLNKPILTIDGLSVPGKPTVAADPFPGFLVLRKLRAWSLPCPFFLMPLTRQRGYPTIQA